jgi:transglutaminase-like putative cysteine protease
MFDLGSGRLSSELVAVTAASTFVVPDSAVWNPGSNQWIPATFDTIRAFRLEHRVTGAPTVTWVDEDGALVSEDIEGGYSLRRSAFEVVSTNYRQVRRGESAAWRRSVPGLVALAADRDSSGRPLAGPFRMTDSAGDNLGIAPNPPGSVDSLDRWRRSFWDTPSLEDPNLKGAAREAVAGASSPADSAAKLTHWVASQIRTDLSPVGFATVMNVLQAGRGHPDGKVRLLVALARATGMPARIIRGIAVTTNGAFAHTWAELWAGQWIPADPLLGQFPAARNLVPVAIGDRSRATDLIPLTASARFLPLGTSP